MGFNKRYAGTPRSIPTWAATVRICRLGGVRVKSCCPECGRHAVAKLKLIERKYGPEFSLFDRVLTCPDCGKAGFFIYSPAKGTPMRPMRTGMH